MQGDSMLNFFWIKQLCDPSNLINPLPLIDPSYPINCKLSIAPPKLNKGTLAI